MLDDPILIKTKSELHNGFVLRNYQKLSPLLCTGNLHLGLDSRQVTENNNSSRGQVSLKFVSSN